MRAIARGVVAIAAIHATRADLGALSIELRELVTKTSVLASIGSPIAASETPM